MDSPLHRFIGSFLENRGLSPEEFDLFPLTGDGSDRRFSRIGACGPDLSFILMENPPVNGYRKRENSAYLRIGGHLFKRGLPVPEIYVHDLHHGWFILEDLGDENLQKKAGSRENRIPLYEKAIDTLFRLQIEGAPGFDTNWCSQTAVYDEYVMRHYEAEYFMESFLIEYLGMEIDRRGLESTFDYVRSVALMADNRHFMHRDFQSRNIMVLDDRMGIIDWQGGRLGPLPYDLASLLIDPYVGLSEKEKNHLYKQYVSLLKGYKSEWIDPFQRSYPFLAIQRNFQILGAYAFLTRTRGKGYFEKYIQPALLSLHALIDELADPNLSPLYDLVEHLLSVVLPLDDTHRM